MTSLTPFEVRILEGMANNVLPSEVPSHPYFINDEKSGGKKIAQIFSRSKKIKPRSEADIWQDLILRSVKFFNSTVPYIEKALDANDEKIQALGVKALFSYFLFWHHMLSNNMSDKSNIGVPIYQQKEYSDALDRVCAKAQAVALETNCLLKFALEDNNFLQDVFYSFKRTEGDYTFNFGDLYFQTLDDLERNGRTQTEILDILKRHHVWSIENCHPDFVWFYTELFARKAAVEEKLGLTPEKKISDILFSLVNLGIDSPENNDPHLNAAGIAGSKVKSFVNTYGLEPLYNAYAKLSDEQKLLIPQSPLAIYFLPDPDKKMKEDEVIHCVNKFCDLIEKQNPEITVKFLSHPLFLVMFYQTPENKDYLKRLFKHRGVQLDRDQQVLFDSPEKLFKNGSSLGYIMNLDHKHQEAKKRDTDYKPHP